MKTKYLLLFTLSVVFIFLYNIVEPEISSGNSSGKIISFKIADSTAAEELGEALFGDFRFSAPEGRVSGLKKDEFSQFRISCRTCHMVDEEFEAKGMRGYTDFNSRTPVPFGRCRTIPVYTQAHTAADKCIGIGDISRKLIPLGW